MGLIIAALVGAALLWLIGKILDDNEQKRRDREFWDRWHEPRRPGH